MQALSFAPCPANPTTRQHVLALGRAYHAWRALQDRTINPDGNFDAKGRWFPDDSERQDCCGAIRSPSAAYPYSLMKHCRSIEHVAARFRVDVSDLRKEIRRREPKAPPAPPADHYKLVAVVDGRYLSIFDGETEYRLGETLREPAKPEHGGGYYCYPDLAAITTSHIRRLFPNDSALADGPFAVLRVQVGGRKIRYENGKVAFSEMTPVAVVGHVVEDNWGSFSLNHERQVAHV